MHGLKEWSWRRGLNPRPSDYKSDALPTELRQHIEHHIKRQFPYAAFPSIGPWLQCSLQMLRRRSVREYENRPRSGGRPVARIHPRARLNRVQRASESYERSLLSQHQR